MKMRLTSYFAVGIAAFAFPTSATTFYVNVNCINPTFPYSGWNTAATNIQDAIDASAGGDQIWVTAWIYQCVVRNANRLKLKLHFSKRRLLQ
ncbi:MAG TPA: hypothetical protein VMB80_17895 [Candidatus Acidoferrum sp.]|nr:hypothetical protein [Candidatus Acidoferrum sp.]